MCSPPCCLPPHLSLTFLPLYLNLPLSCQHLSSLNRPLPSLTFPESCPAPFRSTPTIFYLPLPSLAFPKPSIVSILSSPNTRLQFFAFLLSHLSLQCFYYLPLIRFLFSSFYSYLSLTSPSLSSLRQSKFSPAPLPFISPTHLSLPLFQ